MNTSTDTLRAERFVQGINLLATVVATGKQANRLIVSYKFPFGNIITQQVKRPRLNMALKRTYVCSSKDYKNE